MPILTVPEVTHAKRSLPCLWKAVSLLARLLPALPALPVPPPPGGPPRRHDLEATGSSGSGGPAPTARRLDEILSDPERAECSEVTTRVVWGWGRDNPARLPTLRAIQVTAPPSGACSPSRFSRARPPSATWGPPYGGAAFPGHWSWCRRYQGAGLSDGRHLPVLAGSDRLNVGTLGVGCDVFNQVSRPIHAGRQVREKST
jgi:hypothetical protein